MAAEENQSAGAGEEVPEGPAQGADPEDPDLLRVITFNTAVGNPRITTDQRDFLQLPFYQDIIQGRADAPLLAGQEIGPTQARALKEAAADGNFQVIHKQRPGQGNVLLVPKRFEVLKAERHFYLKSQLRAALEAVRAWVKLREKPDHRQLLELRMWIEALLRDSRSGRSFTIFNTHLSGNPALRLEQARELFRWVHRAAERGPVIVAGDFNTRTSETATAEQDVVDSQVRALFGDLKDMGELAAERKRSSIDYVLARGFTAVSSKLYTGASLQLPGRPRAELISDHYAEEDVLRFA